MIENLQASRDAIAGIVRGILASRFPGKAVPPGIVEAVVDGKGSKEEVRKATAAAYGTEKPFELVLFDTDQIAAYVFESSRPPVIAGASAILRDLNREIAEAYPDWTIFSGGGEGLLLAPHGEGERIAAAIEERYRIKTGGALSVTTGWLPIGPEELVGTPPEKEARDGVRLVAGTQAVLARLRDRVIDKKYGRARRQTSVPGDGERCVSCRDREGTVPIARYRDEPGMICGPCDTRWEVGKELIAGNSFDDLVDTYRSALESQGAKTRYLGFLYADGNSMGALFGRLESLAALRFLSRSVSRIFEATQEIVRREVAHLIPVTEARKLPLLSYLGGGDEAIWIVPGSTAVHVAEQLPAWIDAESHKIPGFLDSLHGYGSPGLTVGMGLVLCDLGYPIRYQYDLAKSLQKSAKALAHDRLPGEVASSIDYELLTESFPLSEDLATARALAYGTEDPAFLLTCRPLSAVEFGRLAKRMDQARAKELATTQLYGLQAGAAEGRAIFLNYLRYQLARKPAGPRYLAWMRAQGCDPATDPAAVERFFLQPAAAKPEITGTWIADGLQLLPFLDQLHALQAKQERRR